jgi:hypothetical protein
MRLGKKGVEFIGLIESAFTDSASLCTTWQQDFFESFTEKVEKFGDEAYITDRQLTQLNKMAEIYGIVELQEKELDNE